MNLKKSIQEFFLYNPLDQKGLILSIVLLTTIAFAPTIYEQYFYKTEIFEPSEAFLAFQEFHENNHFEEKAIPQNNSKYVAKPQKNPILKKFNPNHISKTEWKSMGINDFAIKNLLSYLEKGGSFKSKKDLKKIYGIEKDYDRIVAFIDLPNEVAKKTYAKSYTKKPKADNRNNYSNKNYSSKKYVEKPIILTPFNPNNLTFEEWKKLGVSEFAIKNAMNYLSKGGSFKTKNDLKKVYGIEADFDRIKAFIDLPNEFLKDNYIAKTKQNNYSSYEKKKTYNYEKPIVNIEINSASATDFMKISGIGPVYSERIIKYRDKLGGFYKIEQLNEVYGIEDSLFGKIANQLSLKPNTFEQIDLNNATEEDFSNHIYINYSLAKHLVKFRATKGGFKNVNDLRESYLINEEIFDKLAPYLKVK